ncbi:AI-2E family transporter [Rhodopseudomonas palustris]|uniref:AI-2E family transporter n=1 Tax=Rhodopseudomonas palustris TaxID=1076 RepID=A0A323UCS5_RHOPL|nr:AI-2E family transporter [Rhodopseudomonas palustris]PZA10191.1 AI-2E family transporter [Rhodopseudomonas palustris]
MNTEWRYFRRLLMAAGVVLFGYVAWSIADLLPLVFAAVLLSVLMSGSARLIRSRAPIGHGTSIALVVAALIVALGSFAWLFGAQLVGQLGEVFQRAPGALDAFGSRFGFDNAASRVRDELSSNPSGGLLTRAASIGYSFVGGMLDILLVLVAAVYLAADPKVYRTGLVLLFPSAQHARVLNAMSVTATALRLWFLGQLVSMVLVGIASGVAFWLIGLPSPIGLGLIAGLTNFVPMIGPVVGALPALLLSFAQGGSAVIWTGLAILIIQQLEGNLITPLVQRRAVQVPPALILFAIAGFGLLFGWPGIILAVPLAVTCMVLVQKLWVRQTLGGQTSVPGEQEGAA